MSFFLNALYLSELPKEIQGETKVTQNLGTITLWLQSYF